MYCKALNRLLNIAEEEYFERKFISMKSDMKKNWKLLNDMLGRNRRTVHQEFVIDGVGTEEGAVISKSFCDYFIAYPKSIHDGIPATNHDLSSNHTNEPLYGVYELQCS